MSSEVCYVTGDDWCGLYLNGSLYIEGHSIELTSLVHMFIENSIDCELLSWSVREVNLDWLYDEGSLPPTLAEVVFFDDPYTPPDPESPAYDIPF